MGIQVENKRKQIKENKTSYLKHQEVEFRKFSIKLNSEVVTQFQRLERFLIIKSQALYKQ